MVTPLQILNRARKRNGQSEISALSLTRNTGGQGNNIDFLNDIFATVYQKTENWQWNSNIVNVTLVIGDEIIPTSGLSTTLDINALKEVKYIDTSTNRKYDLVLISPTKADDLKQGLTSNSQPIYYYVQDNAVKVLPVPDAAYQMTLRYQGVIKTVDTNNLETDMVLPVEVQEALVEGVYARLLEDDGDKRKSEVTYQNFLNRDLQEAAERNRSNYRKKGLYRYTKQSRRGDRGF
jgi:hypothetical protein